jgi:NAD(P)-dependent dehydrogenase (short-subunit alcohol dehydrogenase family)
MPSWSSDGYDCVEDRHSARQVRVTVPRVFRIELERPADKRTLEEYSHDQWSFVIDSVLGTAIAQAQEAVECLIGGGGGVVLFIVPAQTGDGAWRTAIAGLHGLVRAIAKEYGRLNIRCNAVVGGSPELERLLVENRAITGELLVAGAGTWGASGLECA